MTRFQEAICEKLLLSAAWTSGSIVVFIFAFMLFLGLPLLSGGHFFSLLTAHWAPQQGSYGILPMMAGSLFLALLGLLFSFPLSLGCACFISVLGPAKLRFLLRKVVELMTGIPTVIYGFVGLFLLVPLVRDIFGRGGLSLLSASLMLALLIAPTMILFFCDSFDRVPRSYLDAVDAMGGSKVQKLLYVMLPNSVHGIAAGITIALGRAVGDTLLALMLAGNAIHIPHSCLDSARTLTSHIGLVFSADFESLEFKAIFACGITLYLFTAVLVLVVRGINHRLRRPL